MLHRADAYDGRMARPRTKILLGRALIEISGILFLFYSNLLMGEFTRSAGHSKRFVAALQDICTSENLLIGVIAATAGFVVFEWFRMKLEEAAKAK